MSDAKKVGEEVRAPSKGVNNEKESASSHHDNKKTLKQKKKKSTSNNRNSRGSNTNNGSDNGNNDFTGGHRRPGQHRRQQKQKNSSYEQAYGEDLDLSIQEELINGNFKLKGKKAQVSINHLLNFNLPEVERPSESSMRRNNNSNRRKNKDHIYNEHINLTGDSFINVNYKLLVKDGFDYTEQWNNPNSIIQDDKIVSVIVPKGQNCPICLCEEPVAPRMVICGHIFCYSCLINFFANEETVKDKNTGYVKKKKFKECPLCSNIVRPQRIKNVIYQENLKDYDQEEKRPQPEAQIKLELMLRPHDSIMAVPISSNVDPVILKDFPNIKNSNVVKYSRIIKCDLSSNLEFLNQDMESIKAQMEIDKALYNDDGKFSQLALDEINNKIISLLSDEGEALSLNESIDSLSLVNREFSYNDSTAYFFYQTSFNTITKYFLSQLDVKILLTIFGQYSKFPSILEADIENIHYDTIVTESLIKRYKYMSHLPLGTELALIDLDWRKISFITKEVYETFSSELKRRRREYNMKKQREDKQKKIYEAKLEEETAAFYRAENNGYYSSQENSVDLRTILGNGNDSSASSSSLLLDSLAGAKERNVVGEQGKGRKKGYKERTVWGTSMTVIPDEKTSRENAEFAEMLRQKMQQDHGSASSATGEMTPPETSSGFVHKNSNDNSDSNNSNGNGNNRTRNRKRGKVVLFSTTQQGI